MAPQFMKRWLGNRAIRRAAGKRSALPKRGKPRYFYPSLEVLESRILLSADNWIAGSGNWDVGTNWSLGHAPGTADTAVINTASTATITIGSSDNISVQNITTGSNDTLSFAGGALTVTSGTSTLSGALSMTGGTLTASGSGVSLTANGSTNISGASLYAQSGATLSLPQMTSYTADNSTFQADGSGSVLDVSAMTSLTQNLGHVWNVHATNGGTVNISGLTSLTGDTGFGGINITDTGGSKLLDSKVTNLLRVNVTLDGSDANVANSWTSMIASTLLLNGGSYNLSGLTDIDNTSLYVHNGGSLSLPSITSYNTQTTSGRGGATFQADGSGSILDVSAMTSLTQPVGDPWNIAATNGGTVNISGLTGLTGDTGGGGINITDTGGSKLLDSKVTSLLRVNVTLDGSDASVVGSWAAFTNGNLSITGGTVSFPNLTSLSGSNLHLSGGAGASFPVLTTGNVTLTNGTSVTIQGTVVSLPTDKTSGAAINVPSSQGLTITLQNSGTLTNTTFNIGAGSNVVLAGGTYLGTTTFNVGQGATVDLTGGQLTTYGGTLTGSGSGTVEFSGGTMYPAVGGVTLNFPGSMLQWTGGAIEATVGDVTNQGTINLAGSSDKQIYADGTLFNYGTIIQTGSGNFDLHSDNVTPSTLNNEAGGLYLLESDAGIGNAGLGDNVLINTGTIRKTAGSGISTLYIPSQGYIDNTGTIEADSGTLFLDASTIKQVASNALTAGTWNALNGATLEFPSSTSIATNQANVSLGGNGASISALAGLATNSGSLTLGGGSTLTLGGNFTQTASGTLNDLIDSPLGGGQLAVSGTATLGGAFNVSLPTGFTPPRSAVYPVMTFASASGTFATVTGLGSKLTEQLNPTSLDLVNGSGTAVALSLSQVTAPTTATTGQQITVNWQVSNSGSTAATSSWQDSVYLSTTPTINGSSILLGSVTHSGGLAASGSYNASLSAAVPALPPGNYYVLVQADSLDQVLVVNRANDLLAASTGQLTVSVPALTPIYYQQRSWRIERLKF